MFTTYRRVLSRPGALLFSTTGLVARLPMSMVSLGIVLLASASTGSYGVAGGISAAFMVANAALAVTQGRLLDALGQATVLTASCLVFAAAMVLLVVALQAGLPLGWAYVGAALAGASLPQVGSSVRARWSHVLDEPRDVMTAYALEAAVDEVVFMVGPVLVTLLATAWHPTAGLLVAIASCVAGTLALSAQRGTQPPPRRVRGVQGRREPMPWRTVVPLAVVSAALGILFGAAEVTTVAFATEQGERSASGALLALWALGSLVAGLVTGAISWRGTPATRVRWGALGMACAMAPLSLVGSIPLMGGLLLVGGLAIAPTLVATMSLTERVVPAARLTEGMAIMQTGLVAGVAPGATLAGVIVDAHGASPAYLVSLGAGTLAALAAQRLPREPGRGPAAAVTG